MARPGPANDEERLPWLEPYRDKAASKAAPAKGKKRGAGRLVGGVAALAAALTAGYYIGQRDPGGDTPAGEITDAPAVQGPILRPPPTNPRPSAEAPPATAEAMPAPTPAPRKFVAAKAQKPVRRVIRQRKIRNAGIESRRLKAVRAAQERRPLPRPIGVRSWPRMPSPGPPGQVIQLGAFRTPARANAAYRIRLARYPLLGRMPRVVVPVITRPRGQILYVLRLGTTSRQQSAVVCRNLRASGDHCLVIG